MKCILIVEDNAANLKLATFLLENAHYAVLTARDAETAVRIAQASRPDLVLMDIQLPGMDGLSATRALQSDPRTRDIPVVALTAFAMRGDEAKMLAAGCRAYVAKPLRYKELLNTIANVLADTSR